MPRQWAGTLNPGSRPPASPRRPLGPSGVVLVGSLLTLGVAQAQSVAPRIVIERPAELPVRMASAKIGAEITGSVAVTTIDLSLFNPN